MSPVVLILSCSLETWRSLDPTFQTSGLKCRQAHTSRNNLFECGFLKGAFVVICAPCLWSWRVICVYVISPWMALCLSPFFPSLSPESNQRSTDCLSIRPPQYPSSLPPSFSSLASPSLAYFPSDICQSVRDRQTVCLCVWEKGHCFKWQGVLLFQTETCNFLPIHTHNITMCFCPLCVCLTLVGWLEKGYLGKTEEWDGFTFCWWFLHCHYIIHYFI